MLFPHKKPMKWKQRPPAGKIPCMANPNPRTDHLEAYCFTSGQDRQKAAINGRKGGVASGVAQRKKKSCAEIAMRVIQSELDPATRAKVEKVTGPLGDDEDTLYAAALAQVVTKAVKGDLRAFRELQSVVERGSGGFAQHEREDDALSAALKEIGAGL